MAHISNLTLFSTNHSHTHSHILTANSLKFSSKLSIWWFIFVRFSICTALFTPITFLISFTQLLIQDYRSLLRYYITSLRFLFGVTFTKKNFSSPLFFNRYFWKPSKGQLSFQFDWDSVTAPLRVRLQNATFYYFDSH